MATQEPSALRQAVNSVLDIANGRHRLSKLVPAALLQLDVVLCALVIWNIPCKPAHATRATRLPWPLAS